MARKRHRDGGGLLIETIMGLAFASLIFQIVAMSGISAYQATRAREQQANAADLISVMAQEIRDVSKTWSPARSEKRTSKIDDIDYTVTATTSTSPEGLLQAEIHVTWKYGRLEKFASRHIPIPVVPES